MNTLFVNNKKMKLRCVQMMVRLVAEKRLGEETHKVKKNPWVFIHGIKKTLENVVFSRVCGGRNRTRTCDPIDVNDVLYQLSHATLYHVLWAVCPTN